MTEYELDRICERNPDCGCNCMSEIWKDIQGYEGLYMVSCYGRIKSVERYVSIYKCNKRKVKPRIIKQSKDTKGYKTVTLQKDGKCHRRRVHRLVAQAFLENPDNLECVNHKNGNKEDNRLGNLEWCTYSENIIHAYKNKLNNRARPVECLLDGKVIKRYESARDAEKDGFSNQLIAHCCNKKYRHKKHGGYEWRYADK